ncbi:hypothetical protein M0R45_036586 [Rubus argutus]|uniref:Uncharacterized protein n=1 Tax=Rubus argutus TaxID=59490 RepID=A0AAW1VYB6_RUBAR
MILLKTLGLRCSIFSLTAFASETKFLVQRPLRSSLQTHLLYRHITSTISAKPQKSTVNYLINSCGLSPEGAIIVSKRLQLLTQKRADSVLGFLRNHGFSQTQISKVVRSFPQVLATDPQKTLLPKLEYFSSLGVSREDLAKTVASNPVLLGLSVEKRLIPTCNFLRSCLLSEKNVVSLFKRCSRVFMEGHSKNVVPNIATLRESGASQSRISTLLTHFTSVMMLKNEKFVLVVCEVKQMGFKVDTTAFICALGVLSGKNSKSIMNRSRQVYMRWGWSEDDVSSAFRMVPRCMIVSEKKIMRVMDFLVNKMGWPSQMIAKHPVIFTYSLEKRLIPRCSVFTVLLLKGLKNENLCFSSVLIPPEEQFLEKFVTKFVDQVPQLLSVYQGNVDVQDV